jgi:hypothetical protein
MFENRQFTFEKRDIFGSGNPAERIENLLGDRALRWYIAQVQEDTVVVEATLGEPCKRSKAPDQGFTSGKSVVVSIIPTGVGCEVGGFAGDAAPATRLLAATVDYLVTNPNAVNASNFISLENNVLYSEGLSIDLFCKGYNNFYLPRSNRVGLVVESSSDADIELVYNVVNTVRAVYGVDILDPVVTDGKIGSRCFENASGAYVGTVDNPEVMFRACEELRAKGADAIAITTNIQDLPHDAYVQHFEGNYPNPMGGVEAIISHSVVNRFGIPAAHGPMINLKELALTNPVVDARGAGEMASASGLACVLVGLSRAPHIERQHCRSTTDVLSLENLLAVVAPSSCLGGIPTICAHQRDVPVIAVKENGTILGVEAEKGGLHKVIQVQSYLEAAGVLTALQCGISIDSVRRPFDTLRPEGAGARRSGLRLAGAAG